MSSLADWYVDPLGRFYGRYFDGARWTDQVSHDGMLRTDPDWPPTQLVAKAPPAASEVEAVPEIEVPPVSTFLTAAMDASAPAMDTAVLPVDQVVAEMDGNSQALNIATAAVDMPAAAPMPGGGHADPTADVAPSPQVVDKQVGASPTLRPRTHSQVKRTGMLTPERRDRGDRRQVNLSRGNQIEQRKGDRRIREIVIPKA